MLLSEFEPCRSWQAGEAAGSVPSWRAPRKSSREMLEDLTLLVKILSEGVRGAAHDHTKRFRCNETRFRWLAVGRISQPDADHRNETIPQHSV